MGFFASEILPVDSITFAGNRRIEHRFKQDDTMLMNSDMDESKQHLDEAVVEFRLAAEIEWRNLTRVAHGEGASARSAAEIKPRL